MSIFQVRSIRRRAMSAVSAIVVSFGLAACAVGMAASGKPSPNLAVCQVGADRAAIERELGPPESVQTTAEGGTSCTYKYEIGDEPSAGRAVYHAGMDVLTIGLWEVFGTAYEVSQGQEFELTVIYDAEGKAREIRSKPIDKF
ncbi:MAG TPA: hypothetical protein VLE23_06295 [Geminicoccaceae bacterium]|nr:hypothetical protein [Geminicoccaceae bacterium]